ncbi:MAG: pilus assembly PilX N-terminal domain-containing protein [Candidatus Moraniibacteriota bacterium]
MNSAYKKKLSGSALVFALIIMTAVAIVLTSVLAFITSQTKYSLRVQAREQAFQIAESGIHFYRWYLAHQVEGRTAQQVQDFWTSGSPYGVGTAYEAEYVDPAGSAVGKYRITVTPPELGSTVVTVRSTGWTYRYPDDMRTLEVRFRRPSWSESAVLANDFMRFGAGTETFGKIHSNQGIRFDGVAHNVVSSSVATYDDPDHTGNNEFGVHTHDPMDPLPPAAVPVRTDIFEAGRTFPVATVDFNGVLGDLNYMKSEAQAGANGNRYFANDSNDVGRRIVLKADGTFGVCKVAAANFTTTNGITSYRRNSGSSTCGTCSGLCLSTYTIPDNGIIFVEDNVWIDGQISNKKVTIAAADLVSGSNPSVYIGNDITYSNYDGHDIIGIIGQRNIEIIRDSDTNLRIDAALLAQQGRIGRANYGSSDSKNSITIYGALATNQRYGFAWTNGTANWGYATRNLYYDNNLLYYPPPYFPTGTQYQMDLWEEK